MDHKKESVIFWQRGTVLVAEKRGWKIQMIGFGPRASLAEQS